MSDVFSISVPIVGPYASVNGVGGNSHRAGKKSQAYRALFVSVKKAAEAEIARTGWTTATANCLAIIVRYVPDGRRCDAMNLGKCEWDALTAAGVWQDDRWANPSLPWIVPNAGEHCIAIVVVKIGAQERAKSVPGPLADEVSPPSPNAAAESGCSSRTEAGASAASHSEPMAKLAGKDVTREFALDLIRKYG